MSRTRCLLAASAALLAALPVAWLTVPRAAAQQPGERIRVEGTLAYVAYDGSDSTIGLRLESGEVREIRLRQFHVDQWPTMIDIMNAGNRVVYEVGREGTANFFPTAVHAPARAARPPTP
ncbi:MAG: hypothetical protein KA383_09800 [Phycisphaerae bacterium]|nr:hypothetical protein [Phycisphaerae bacterium]